MALFVSIKVARDDAMRIAKELEVAQLPKTVTISSFKQSPVDAKEGTYAFLGLGGDDTGGRLPYKRGIAAFGRITQVTAGEDVRNREVKEMQVDLLHVLDQAQRIDKHVVSAITHYGSTFEQLPHWGTRHTASQTVLPLPVDHPEVAKAILEVYCSKDAKAQATILAACPDLEDILSDYVTPSADLAAAAQSFADSLTASKLAYGPKPEHERLAKSFLAALITKRFVILTGSPGSGKTQIALRFGDWLSYGKIDARDNRVLAVSVRPDWTGSEALFGYPDVLQRTDNGYGWNVPLPLEFMLRATRDPEHPYLLLLDELNLAHVERYLADFLSGMESAEPVLPNLERNDKQVWLPAEGPARLPIPTNLFVIGTVNVDETAHAISPKVLDRASTFEFRVRTEDLVSMDSAPTRCAPGDASLVAGVLQAAQDPNWHFAHAPKRIEEFMQYLRTLHALLYGAGSEFSKRTFNEAVRFAAAFVACGGGENPEDALDHCVLQKLLPRLHGPRRQIEPLLCGLARFCDTRTVEIKDLERAPGGSFKRYEPSDGSLTPALPYSFDKLRRMIKAVRDNQYVSFTQ